MRRLWRWIKSKFTKKKVPKVPVQTYVDATTPKEWGTQTMYPPLTVDAHVHGGTIDQREFMRSCLSIMRHVINSTAFQDGILDFTNWKWTEDDSRKIYERFMTGKDLYDTAIDNEMDIDVTIYYNRWTKTVGYTYPNTRKQYINWKYVSSNKIQAISIVIANIVHEGCHNLGYKHPYKVTKSVREQSVPYVVGNLAKYIAVAFMTNNIENGDK